MRTEIKELVEKIKSALLAYQSDKSKENKKILQFFVNDILREKENDNAEENTYILKNILPITSKIFEGYGISATLMETPRMKVSKPIWSILSELNLLEFPTIKAVDYKINPKDTNLEKIFKNIISTDDLRPIMMGMNFEGDVVTGTDAHKLFHLKGNRVGKFKDGNYKPYSKILKEYEKSLLNATVSFDEYYKNNAIIEGKYPNYLVVIPRTYDFKKTFDLAYLNGIVKTIVKNGLENQQSHAIAFKFKTKDGDFYIGFNGEYLSRICESFMLSGHSLVNFYFSSSTSAVVILSQEKQFPKEKQADDFFKENTFGLLMPVQILDIPNRYVSEKESENDYEDLSMSLPLIEYNDIYDFDIKIGDSPSFNTALSNKKENKVQNKIERTESKANMYKRLIEGYELALELESESKKIKMYKQLIDGYKIALELE